jgi:hypothetical protein
MIPYQWNLKEMNQEPQNHCNKNDYVSKREIFLRRFEEPCYRTKQIHIVFRGSKSTQNGVTSARGVLLQPKNESNFSENE